MVKLIILTLPVLLAGCITYPSAVCKDGVMYTKQGLTSVYTKTVMNCIEVENYFQSK
jgi:starvation-inducible outer membrane lipoprotein